MLGFLLLFACLVFGLCSCFRFCGRLWFGLRRTLETKSSQEKSQTPERENNSERLEFEYDVFLSFRGSDSRQGLADVLYNDMRTAGIRVYRDDDELQVGDEIGKILHAIDNSKICVPIFSRNFAESTWCLREVERMVEKEKKVMPVFYTATPDDVKLRTELFEKDLKEHEKRHGREQVKRWEDALKAVGRIRGDSVGNTGYAKFSKLFVRAVSIKLTVKMKNVTDNLVKIDDQEETVIKLLDVDDTDDVRLVGIHGMAGVGKTTLAKVVFNRLSSRFNYSSFRENVQESLRRDGLENLQRQLLEDLDPKLKHFPRTDSILMLKENFRKRKVLIVLDDVTERKQVEMIAGALGWFGSGSRIIITSRDRRVFTREALCFEMKEMSWDQALQIFSKNAFGSEHPPKDYQILSNEVLPLTGRLPLAIEVMGSFLYQCDRKRWTVTIKKLRNVPNDKIQEKLKISFDALDYEQKQIFLDIACFFINMERSSAAYMWEACDFYPDDGIEVLVSLSLVKITKENMFWMHDLIRDFGRRLVREECFSDPSRRSRIWSGKEALEVLKLKQGKEKVEGLSLDEPSDRDMTDAQFSTFRNLRLLQLVGSKLVGDFEDLLPKLKWFSWHQCPSELSPMNLCLQRLVILDLSWSFVTEKWFGWSLIEMAENLKVLDLSRCRNLHRTPDLYDHRTLERLIFRGCHELFEIHSSIGKLERLKHLDLRECYSLTGLPEELGSLSDLEEILMDGNGNSFCLPQSLGKLCSLSVVKLHGVEISGIPDSVGGLVNLTRLSLRRCTGIVKLPESLGDMVSLVELDLSFTRISSLPVSLGRLLKLEVLSLQSTNVHELPESFRNLKTLTKLDARSSELRVLPDSVGDMNRLRWMVLDGCKIRELPSSIGKLTKLKILSAHSCRFLKGIPEEIGNLSTLRELYLGDSGITGIPTTLGRLSLLRALRVTINENSVCHSDFQWIESLKNLSWLHFEHSGLTELPFNSGGLTRLRSLQLFCPGPGQITQLPPALSELKLGYTTKSTNLPDLSGLKNLSRIEFTHCSPKDEPEGLKELQVLEHVVLNNCSVELVELSCKLENLRSLTISRPESSVMLLDFSCLKKLIRVKITDCHELVELRGIEKLELLVNLTISNCHSLERLGNVSGLKRLVRLHITDCPKLGEIRGVERLLSTYVHIEGCASVQNLNHLKKR